jgi:type I restriction enzyme R subunit
MEGTAMTTTTNVKEIVFEEAIEDWLLEDGGYEKGDPKAFDRILGLEPDTLFRFIQESQPDKWKELLKRHGSEENARKKTLDRLVKEIDKNGILHVLRFGYTDLGVVVKVAFFRPESRLNHELWAKYESNILTVTRQVHFSADNNKSVDVLISVNGLPTATLELKNPFTGQNVSHAVKQYRADRDPREPLFQFKKRALVHFAVDPDEVMMTTRLRGEGTHFMPFNRGVENGAGNPSVPGRHKTCYLWEQVLKRESWLEILGRFMHLEVTEDEYGKKFERMIFPRWHQLDLIRKIQADVLERGCGEDYLVQHSAGSGKTNSIAWTAHRLATLHNSKDNLVFDGVVVISDRVVLDRQLQDAVEQFEQRKGMVKVINKNSGQLADALNSGERIIVTTIQKFPFIMEKIADLPDRHYAVIVDEAHSSQTGETAQKMKEVLSPKDLDDAEKQDTAQTERDDQDDLIDEMDAIRKVAESRGKKPNLSFFAFTATPKRKTLEMFGRKDMDGHLAPFHLYSMRQAIEEHYILDVLRNYTTYALYYKLTKHVSEDPEVKKRRSVKEIARFVQLHPYNIAQKVEIIIEHFREFVMPRIGGRAKAMVVTSSRLAAVRYKLAFDDYIKKHGYTDLKALVAFTGQIEDPEIPGSRYSEPEMNRIDGKPLPEKQLPRKFATDEYKVLLVAEKYQTGYDQPLLCAMYVDKKLHDLKAVQTLSRLNRIYPGKDRTFILDFVNTTEEIRKAFQPYYESTFVETPTDPNILYDLRGEIEGVGLFDQDEVDRFAKVFFGGLKDRKEAHARLNAILDTVVGRFNAVDDDEKKAEYKRAVKAFIRAYAFLSQVMPYSDVELEKLYAFLRMLFRKLPYEAGEEQQIRDGEIEMEYYKLKKIIEGDSVELVKDEGKGLREQTFKDRKNPDDAVDHLSAILELINEKYNTNFSEDDKVFIQRVRDKTAADPEVQQLARNNTLENFQIVFRDVLVKKAVELLETHRGTVTKILNEDSVKDDLVKALASEIFRQVHKTEAA